jgi:hypothetical protein
VLAKVGNGFDRIRTGTKVPCGGTLLVGKDVQPLQSVKPIRIVVSTVLDESRCGHKTSVWVRKFHGVSGFLEKCAAVCLGYSGRGVR